ncbi:sulfatase-like hydrolase/transferase [Roseibacillus persicicus]|uniref:sulfatase family protein n=1 Tax=Roseibacillus persicicus TaxID=454148 RepID=UPI00398B80D0
MLRPLRKSLAASLLLLLPSQGEESRPNVIFIITDDQRQEDLGFLKNEALTPSLDKLANEGAFFSNSYTSSTVCTPSRYGCITGRYPSRGSSPALLRDVTPEGVRNVYFNTHLEADRPNLPKAMQAAGYVTGLIGKWHIGTRVKLEQIPKNSDPTDPSVRAKLQANQTALCAQLRTFGFDHVARAYAGNPLDSPQLKNTGLAHHNMDWVTEGALEFIESNKDNPFFLYFSTTLPHFPDPVAGMTTDPRSTPAGILDQAPVGMPSRESLFAKAKAAGFSRDSAGQTWLDAGIGAILNKVESLGLAENTLVIYFNDHGMEMASKSSLYQGALRTPSAAYWPGTIEPQVCEALVSNVDIAPTILDATGTEPLPDMPLDGESYLPLLRGEQVDWRKAVYGEIGFTRTVVTRDWKYLAFRLPPSQVPPTEEAHRLQKETLDEIKANHAWVKWEFDPNAKIPHIGGPPGGNFLVRLTMAAKPPYLENYFDADQLYDLRNDPTETTNLAGDPAHQEQLRQMKSLLSETLSTLPGTFGEWSSAQ